MERVRETERERERVREIERERERERNRLTERQRECLLVFIATLLFHVNTLVIINIPQSNLGHSLLSSLLFPLLLHCSSFFFTVSQGQSRG